jgi:hypothetical protein
VCQLSAVLIVVFCVAAVVAAAVRAVGPFLNATNTLLRSYLCATRHGHFSMSYASLRGPKFSGV